MESYIAYPGSFAHPGEHVYEAAKIFILQKIMSERRGTEIRSLAQSTQYTHEIIQVHLLSSIFEIIFFSESRCIRDEFSKYSNQVTIRFRGFEINTYHHRRPL